MGAQHFVDSLKESTVSKLTFEAFVIASNYERCLIDGECAITISREILKQFKMFLEYRMTHCEKVRDHEVSYDTVYPTGEEFNPDSYITQKLLLISIREALLGEIIN